MLGSRSHLIKGKGIRQDTMSIKPTKIARFTCSLDMDIKEYIKKIKDSEIE